MILRASCRKTRLAYDEMHMTYRIFCALAFLALAIPARAEMSKADQIFMKRGLVIHALCFPDNVMHLKTIQDCGFTGVTWGGPSANQKLAPPPGFPWSRWIQKDDDFALTPDEQPYASSCVALQFHDEQDLNSDKLLGIAKNWFEAMRPKFPNTILYTNQYGGLLTDKNFGRYIETCHPDMLSFDTYPMWKDQDNWRSYFGDLQRYHAFSTSAGIPFGTWMQTFHGEDKYVDPSESELRLDIFGAWTFGAKMQQAFTYNAGSSSLFKKTFNGSGDTVLNVGYEYLKRILHESHMLSPYLVKLRCVDTSWILGKGSEYPWGVAPWKFNSDVPQLRGIMVKNTSKLKGGEAGDVAVGVFHPLEGSENEWWIMITNALTDRHASADGATQKVILNLVLKPGTTLQKVNRVNGKLETPEMKRVGETNRNLVELDLPGGTGELICISTSGDGQK
jgi:hypothetical protein